MRRLFASARPALLLTALGGLTACGAGHDSYVRGDDSALGRVVVYRNGIAYYERRATPIDAKITLAVPQDKVDDFLKSLTVTDASTGKTLPISYPTTGASQGSVVDMTIQLPTDVRGEVIITYITDSPAWKPSYRLVVGDDNTVNVQGWAIVDNASGEDWTKVKVGVGASSALSFRYDLRSVVHVHRQTLGAKQAFVQAPPTGKAVHRNKTQDGVLLALNDAALPSQAGHPAMGDADDMMKDTVQVQAERSAAVATLLDADMGGETGSNKESKAGPRRATAARAPQDTRLQGLANRLRGSGEHIVIEGYSAAHEPAQMGQDRGNRVRNTLIGFGVAPNRVKVQSKGHVNGRAPGVALKVTRTETAQDDGQPVGESHFESGVAMTIKRGTSAMVAVLDQKTDGEVVYLYNPDSARGDSRYAFKAVRLKNPTDFTLESGPVTVYGSKRFIGEGLTENIPPRSTALVPFAQDKQVTVETDESVKDAIGELETVNRGVFTARMRHTRTTKMKVHNRAHTVATVFLRHLVPDGWTLDKAPAVYEKQGEAHLFAVTMQPGESKTVSISAYTPITRTVDLRSAVGVELMTDWLQARSRAKAGEGSAREQRFAKAVRQILTVHNETAEARTRIAGHRANMGEFRTRKNELSAQITRLEETRAGDALRKHLVKKLIDMEKRLQDATLAVVKQQEALMLSRIRFQDAVAELTLGEKAKLALR
ncbi:MAG: outer membrane protein OmpA-like peptidoglycan-associated protein [Bradymonadia bacterium]|jgi:outer membrane protein OmpA-like peptidoglycan-associated protein